MSGVCARVQLSFKSRLYWTNHANHGYLLHSQGGLRAWTPGEVKAHSVQTTPLTVNPYKRTGPGPKWPAASIFPFAETYLPVGRKRLHVRVARLSRARRANERVWRPVSVTVSAGVCI